MFRDAVFGEWNIFITKLLRTFKFKGINIPDIAGIFRVDKVTHDVETEKAKNILHSVVDSLHLMLCEQNIVKLELFGRVSVSNFFFNFE